MLRREVRNGSMLSYELIHSQNHTEQGRYLRHDVGRDIPAARARVGDEFLFVEGLGGGERLLGAHIEMNVTLLLKRGEVVQQRRGLLHPFLLHLCNGRLGG